MTDPSIQQTPIPQWKDFVRLMNRVAEPMKKVMQHIVFWYHPTWKYPEHASNALKNFNWVDAITPLLFPTMSDNKNSADVEGNWGKSLALVETLWKQVEKHEKEFHALDDDLNIAD